MFTTDHRTAEDTIRRKPWATDVLNFCQYQLHLNHPRDDYRELRELVVIFIRGVPHGRQSIAFRKPGALYRARWIARAIYVPEDADLPSPVLSPSNTKTLDLPCVTIGRSRKKLIDFCIFHAKHYVRAWFLSRSAVSALRQDIDICKTLEDDNAIIKKAGTKTLARHLWFLSEVTVGMALFD